LAVVSSLPELLPDLLQDIRNCRHCAEHLPLGPRPVLIAPPAARLLIIGQAPGTKVHETGIPWNDRSGDRLREWLGIDRDTFYNSDRIGIVPMGFCYPGVLPKGGDAPPRPECAPLWHERILAHLSSVELTLLVGTYAQKHYLGRRRQKSLTETVKQWRCYGPSILPLPHPSWRSTTLLAKNPWIEAELLPELQQQVRKILE
jgi:uracil-DNA glycosylase